MLRMLVLLVVTAASLLVAGCGGGAAAPSPNATRPSPNPAPTALSQRQQLVVYLRQLTKDVKRTKVLGKRSHGILSAMSTKRYGHSTLQARSTRVAEALDQLSVSVAAWLTLPCTPCSQFCSNETHLF